jgi:hypothetical protein
MSPDSGFVKCEINARTFQKPLAELAETVAYKVQREAVKVVTPSFVAIDIYFMIRHALKIYELFFYLNADDRRKTDPYWHVGYSAAVLPLIRCMIDCLYNITSLLEDPQANGRIFRASGYRQMLQAVEEDREQYGGNPFWDAHIDRRRKHIDFDMRVNNFSFGEVSNAKRWPTLSRYLRLEKNVAPTPHQQFLKKLTFGFWDEYSGMAHATFQGLSVTGLFYATRDLPHEDRPQLDDTADAMISMHLTRVVGVLLCILTEVQACFRFEGARINQRLHDIWRKVLPALEIKELYDERYEGLMRDRGINPD